MVVHLAGQSFTGRWPFTGLHLLSNPPDPFLRAFTTCAQGWFLASSYPTATKQNTGLVTS